MVQPATLDQCDPLVPVFCFVERESEKGGEAQRSSSQTELRDHFNGNKEEGDS